MQIHQLSKTKLKGKKRIGRGGKRGTYSGRGGKGQTARSGSGKIRPAIRDFIQRVHKLRGVPASRYKKQGPSIPTAVEIVNFSDIEKRYKDGEVVSAQSLLEKKLVRKVGRKAPNVKILGKGELTKKLSFKDVKMSKKASAKVDKKSE